VSAADSALATPRTSKGLATRARLLECAQREAIRTGGQIEIAAVAEAAGVVPSLVHRYFASKAGLVSALVDEFFDRMHEQVMDENMDDQGTWPEHERIRLERTVRFHYSDPFAVVLYARLAREPAVSRTEATRIARVVGYAAASIRRAQVKGELPADVDPRLAGAAMFGAMRQLMVEALGRTPRVPEQTLVEVLWRQVAASVHIDPAHP
jgi:AcrR family transcriptional regulator